MCGEVGCLLRVSNAVYFGLACFTVMKVVQVLRLKFLLSLSSHSNRTEIAVTMIQARYILYIYHPCISALHATASGVVVIMN